MAYPGRRTLQRACEKRTSKGRQRGTSSRWAPTTDKERKRVVKRRIGEASNLGPYVVFLSRLDNPEVSEQDEDDTQPLDLDDQLN